MKTKPATNRPDRAADEWEATWVNELIALDRMARARPVADPAGRVLYGNSSASFGKVEEFQALRYEQPRVDDREALLNHLDEAWSILRRQPLFLDVAREHPLAAEFRKSSEDPFVEVVRRSVPERWADRTSGREVSPVKFLDTHYKSFLKDKRFTRHVLQQVDGALCRSYDTWLSRHTDEKLRLPRTPYVRRIEDDTPPEPAFTPEDREQLNRLQSQRYRAKKVPGP